MLRKKTPIGKLEEQPNVHPAQEKDPLPAHPGGVNPENGESVRLLTQCDIWAVFKNLSAGGNFLSYLEK